jgi:hypothetical protein
MIGVLAALWAAVELSLGTTLHALRVPFRGAFLTLLSLILMFAVRYIIPRRGSVLALGFTTAMVRWLLGGGFAPQISLAITLEALLVEIGLGPVRIEKIPPFRAALGGALALGYTAVHPVLLWGVLLGGAHGIALPHSAWAVALLFGTILLHMVVGGIGGVWLLKVSERLLNLTAPIGWWADKEGGFHSSDSRASLQEAEKFDQERSGEHENKPE